MGALRAFLPLVDFIIRAARHAVTIDAKPHLRRSLSQSLWPRSERIPAILHNGAPY
jgi:hypothetical protein